MTPEETLELFELISRIDERVLRLGEDEQAAQLMLWSSALAAVPFAFAGRAIGEHYAESAYPVMPKDIATRWRKAARDLLERQPDTFEPCAYPHLDPDDEEGYRAALRANREAVITGSVRPGGLRELRAASVRVSPGAPNDEYLRARDEMRRRRLDRAGSEVKR
ncbi:hypothetical protein ACH4YN_37895 [Streptomyces griseofuscus]|uniref:hypothetical protein n=1 Tax=Streptomyces griseofuscus TaxID=146922 RepID=UPI0037BD3010